MGKKTPKAPAAPDPAQTAAAQTESNKQTAYYNALLNNVNQNTPYGNLSYTNSGDFNNPNFSSTITLSPEQQKLYDTQTRSDNYLATLGEEQLGRIGQSVSTPYSYEGLPSVYGADDMSNFATNAENAIYSRLDPKFAQDEEALRTRLINQGITQGSEAYRREMDQFGQTKNDARTSAVLSGQQYASALLNDSLKQRNQAIGEYDTQRNAPLNEYVAMTNGSQVTNPTFTSTNYGGAQSGDLQGATQNSYQGSVNNYNQKIASGNATKSALFGLGGSLATAALFSDERLKNNIVPMGKENGHNIYEFSYKGNPKRYVGVMAQEVEETNPEAVIEVDGIKKVKYDLIGVNFREVA